MPATPRRSTRRNVPTVLFATFALVAMLLAGSTVGAPSSSMPPLPRPAPEGPSAVPAPSSLRGETLPSISDGGNLSAPAPGGGRSTITDSVGQYSGLLGSRSYTITLRTPDPLAGTSAELTTDPIAQWANPTALPEGPDALPGLGYWSWQVRVGSVNDTSNWTAVPSSGSLSRTIGWQNATFTVIGTASPTVDVSFDPSNVSATAVTGAGFSVNAAVIGARNGMSDPALSALIAGLHPALVRAGVSSLGTIDDWNNTTGTAALSFGSLDWFLGLAHNLSAESYLSVPSGTWGDGNQLPATFPVNTTVPVTVYGSTGWFPALGAYASLVGEIATHVAATGENVSYWNIGNEVPVSNATLLSAYIGLFNAAAGAIHAVLPNARVGSDVMTDPSVLPTFAAQARGVGFLAFHYYPAQAVCVVNLTLCAPGSSGEDLTDAQLWDASSGFAHLRSIALGAGQRQWHNLTGRWVPVVDAESNLNTAGGSPATAAAGSDPRQQMLFGAAWTVSMLVDASASNVSRFDYYALESPPTVPATVTGPYGGWGFGLVGLGSQGNVTPFAPWWAVSEWNRNLPAGSPALAVTVSDANLSRAIAVRNGTGGVVVLANRVDTPVTYDVTDRGAAAGPIRVTVLDRTSFVTTFNATAPRLSIVRSGVATNNEPAGDSVVFTVQGYGVAVVQFGAPAPRPPAPPPPLLTGPTFVAATLVGGALLAAATLVVAYRPRRSRRGNRDPEGGVPAPPTDGAGDSEDEL